MLIRNTWLLGFVALGAVSAACATGAKSRNRDNDGSGGGTMVTTSTGNGSSCAALCTKSVAAHCPNGADQMNCVADCEDSAAQTPEQCKDEYDALMSCSMTKGTVTCDAEGQPKVSGCEPETSSYVMCLTTTVSSSTPSASVTSSSTSASSTNASSTGAGGAGSCYAGQGSCNPLTPSCGAGESCDIDGGTNMFSCFPPPNTATMGQACDNSAGPYCQHGLACDALICREYCCSTTDCTTGTCQQVGMAGNIVVQVCK